MSFFVETKKKKSKLMGPICFFLSLIAQALGASFHYELALYKLGLVD